MSEQRNEDATGNSRPWEPTVDELAQFRQMFGPVEDQATEIERELLQAEIREGSRTC